MFSVFSAKCCKIMTISREIHLKIISTTKMHSSRMRTACSSSRPGGGVGGSPTGTPQEEASPKRKHPPPRGSTPPLVNRMTNRCKNITLAKTSFADGNEKFSLLKNDTDNRVTLKRGSQNTL